MLPKFETPHFDTLLTEQEVVQNNKFQGRLLGEYNSHIFPSRGRPEPRPSAITDFLRPLCQGDTVSLDSMLRGVYETNAGEPVRWVDMGAGRGLPMRQLASSAENRDKLTMTMVDLFDFGLEGLKSDETDYLEELSPGMTDEVTAPRFIQADVETVILPEPADVITSVEAMQYLNNPLAAVSNWYNQLTDNGVLIISTDHDWTGWVRYQREPGQGDRDETPTKHLLEELDKSGVAHAASYESDWEGGFRPDLDPGSFRNLVIQKRPGTQMVVNSIVTEVWVNPDDYKAAYYEEPEPSACPVIEVIAA